MNFIDNHDIPRFAYDKPCSAPGDCPALRNALALLLTEKGIPCIYYGTEQSFNGARQATRRVS